MVVVVVVKNQCSGRLCGKSKSVCSLLSTPAVVASGSIARGQFGASF